MYVRFRIHFKFVDILREWKNKIQSNLPCVFGYIKSFVPEPPGVSPGRGLLIPLGYLHPGKCEHSEVQSHPPLCNGQHRGKTSAHASTLPVIVLRT